MPPDGDAVASARLHTLIAAQASRLPEALAIDSRLGALTYGELYGKASALAEVLRKRGAGPGVTVAVLRERSPEMVVDLLAVLECGAAYLPLDAAYPRDRIAFILEDARAPLVLAGSHLESTAISPSTPSPRCNAADDLAYVIYTSGSTGKPKGVEITHAGLVNFLLSMRKAPGLLPSDVVAALSTISFDIAALELWLPLVTGGRIALFTREEASDGRLLGRLLRERRVTVAQATPATWRMLLESGWPGDPALTVLCGGEEMTRDLASRLLPRCAALWNVYGPTETTVWSLIHRVTPGTGPVPIGRPIDNTSAHVLDEALRPVPPGAEGELYIGGRGVARGYRNRPDLTNERFIPDIVSGAAGARLYRTGDLVRALPDGSLVFLGRLDQQLKVRGFRVEAGEVESALLEDPAVAQAAVVARPESDGGHALAAHLVPRAGAAIDQASLRARLRRALPEYMVPTRIQVHAALPLTPSGKVDRKLLASVRPQDGGEAYVAPRDDAERRLARIWQEVLETGPVGVTTSFFDLGGHSLLAAALFAQIAREFGVELPIAALVDAPTVEGLARRLRQPVGRAWDTLVPIRDEGSQPPLFFVHGGGGTVLFLRDLTVALPAGRPVYGLQSDGQDGRRLKRWRVEEMAARYIEALRREQPRGPYYIGGYCFGGLVAFEMARHLRAAGEELGAVVLVNPTSPPRARAVLSPGNAEDLPHRATPMSPEGSPESRRRAGHPPLRRASALLARVARRPTPFALARTLGDGLAWRWCELAARHPVRHASVRILHALLAPGWRLPPSWRPDYVNTMTERSERAYRPKPFDGHLDVLSGAGLSADPTLGWGQYATTVQATVVGRHQRLRRELVMPPLVWEVAEIIGRILDAPPPPPASTSGAS